MKYLRIPKLADYQHYKNRAPAWIKLHANILSSRTWVKLKDGNRVLMIVAMLLASKTGNRIPLDGEYIRRVAYLDRDPDFADLVELGFVEVVNESGEAQADASEGSKTEDYAPDPLASAVAEIWEHYIATVGKNPKVYTLTDKRQRMAKARLEDLLQRIESEPKLEKAISLMKLCIDRLAGSEFHNGKNDQHKRFLDWEILFRSTDQMEKWLDDSRFEVRQ